MRFRSSRSDAPPASFAEVLLTGLAPDGGLYLPHLPPPLPEEELRALEGAPFRDVAVRVARHLLCDGAGDSGALDPGSVGEITRRALDFEVAVRSVDDAEGGPLHLLELFHGPTLAFKDVGARWAAEAMEALAGSGEGRAAAGQARPAEGGGEASRPRTVLVATSGDTGGAVADAFHGRAGFRVVVLYPAGRVSPIQAHQFTTLGGNVTAVRVDGSFDDCHRIAREAFTDPELRASWRLTSANSVNPGRLLPQIFYYIHAAVTLSADGRIAAPSAPLVFSVPSGNLGNLTAGLYAKRMGLTGARFVAATNQNDTLPRYLRTGRYRPRPSVATVSSAMDVGAPSNLERIRALYDDDAVRLGRTVMAGGPWSDGDTLACMREVRHGHGLLLDPHTAVAWLGLQGARSGARASGPEGDGMLRSGATAVVLATAHPAKFPDVVERATGERPEPPGRLRRRLDGEPEVVDAEASLESVADAVARAETKEKAHHSGS